MEVRVTTDGDLPPERSVAVLYTATARVLLVRAGALDPDVVAELADVLAPC